MVHANWPSCIWVTSACPGLGTYSLDVFQAANNIFSDALSSLTVSQSAGHVTLALVCMQAQTLQHFGERSASVLVISEGCLAHAGHLVFFGPASDVMPFFNDMGFALPPRKGVPDFLQEVTSRKDQQVTVLCMKPSLQSPCRPASALQ